MTPPQFGCTDVEKKYDEAETARLSKRPRERNIGAGHRFSLSLRDRSLCSCSTTEHKPRLFAGWCLAWAKPPCQGTYRILNRWHGVHPHTRCTAAVSKAQSIEDLEALIPGLAVLVDVSEQPIYRPQDDETQKEHYSGKAKRHTMKTQTPRHMTA